MKEHLYRVVNEYGSFKRKKRLEKSNDNYMYLIL